MCFCRQNIKTPFCPDCNTAMFLRIKELTEERDELLREAEISQSERKVIDSWWSLLPDGFCADLNRAIEKETK